MKFPPGDYRHSMNKHAKGKRKKGIFWDYNLDGMVPRERIKGFYKRYWRKWRCRMNKEMYGEVKED